MKVIPPEIDRDSEPYWEYLRKKDLHLQKCGNCGQIYFPPCVGCHYCGSYNNYEWVPVQAKGQIYSWIVIVQPIAPILKDDVPFAVALVKLDDGPRIAGRIVDCPSDEIYVDMRVDGKYEVIDENLTLLNFKPVKE